MPKRFTIVMVLSIFGFLAYGSSSVEWLQQIKVNQAPPLVEGTEIGFLAQFVVRGGPIASLNVTGGIQDGGILYDRTFTNLHDGGMPRVSFRWTAVAGTHTAYFFLNTIQRGSQRRYRTQVSFQVQRKPLVIVRREGEAEPGAGAHTAVRHPVLQKADIIITGMTCIPENPKAGEKIELEISVKNAGQSSAPRSDLKVDLTVTTPHDTFGKTIATAFPALPAQAVATVKTEAVELVQNDSPVGGDLKVKIAADTLNRVDETLENNNSYSAKIPVTSRTDLVVYDFGGMNIADLSTGIPQSGWHTDQLAVKAGDPVHLTVRIRAYDRFFWGTVLSPGKVLLKFTDFQDFIVPASFIKRNDLNGYMEFVFQLIRNWSTPGTKSCRVEVDADHEIDESKEFNNAGLFIVNVL